MSKKLRLTVIAISIWTVLQTIFHAFWVIYSYLLTICQIKPTYYDVVFVYLTYFYRQSCGDINITNEAFFLNSNTEYESSYSNETVADTLYAFLKATLAIGKLPEQSSAASRTSIYLFLFLYTDVTWIVSSVFLFAGAFFERKKKVMSILFYGPWMLICLFACFLDVVASVHFGLDILYTQSYTTWLNFIGVSNYQEFKPFNDYPSSKFILAMPSTIVVCLLSRIFIVWLVNIFCFFFILFMAIPDIFFKMVVRPARPKSQNSGGSKLRFDTGGELDLNSSEARIRNWQLFYGAIEANSTMASSSSNSSETSSDTDHNSNSTSSDGNKETSKKQLEARFEKNIQDQSPSSVNSEFRRYSDVAHGISALPTTSRTSIKMEVLRGQLPWSYISPDGQYVGKNHMYMKKPVQKSVKIEDCVTECSHL